MRLRATLGDKASSQGRFQQNKTKGNKLPIQEDNIPVTVRLTAKLILGSVLTWHSYCPVSAIRAPRILKPQKSLLLECTDSNRLSAEKVSGPDVSMCKSFFLIQDTCTKFLFHPVITYSLHWLCKTKLINHQHICVEFTL